VQRKLEDFATRMRKRTRALEKERSQLRRERDVAIREAYDGGLPLEDIAAILEVSHQWCSRIVRHRT
jgi:hypothetical protein